jgi:hypothetical protein
MLHGVRCCWMVAVGHVPHALDEAGVSPPAPWIDDSGEGRCRCQLPPAGHDGDGALILRCLRSCVYLCGMFWRLS